MPEVTVAFSSMISKAKKFVIKLLSQMEPEIDQVKFFKFHEKLMHGTFLIFCMRLEQQKSRKLGKMILMEFWFGGFLGAGRS